MSVDLKTPIEFVKGVGPQRAQLLKTELGIFTLFDLLHHFPFRYVDRSEYQQVSDIPIHQSALQLKGVLTAIKEGKMGKRSFLSARFQDETGVVDLKWFQGYKYILPKLKLNTPIQVYGKASKFGTIYSISHPEITELLDTETTLGWQAVYSTTEKLSFAGLNSKGLWRLISKWLEQNQEISLDETLPINLIQKRNLLPYKEALFAIHNPQKLDLVPRARERFKFDELLLLQLEILLRKHISLNKTSGQKIASLGGVFNNFYAKDLPFELTGAQKKVLREIRKDLGSGMQMNRLLQGDVGSGKTLVALLSMLMGIDSGLQSCLMAPTEILASQHFDGLIDLLKNTEIKIELLTGSVKKSIRKGLHERIKSGETSILIGTHALLEDVVEFKNLGIVIVDEQHRFGVGQRARLWKKNTIPPHILVMTATPIPRTLAMTLYGDLDVSVIDELPPGRKPITTKHFQEKSRLKLFGFMRQEIALGRQIYLVYPLIEESSVMDYANLMDGFDAISKSFPLPDYAVSIVHGRMTAEAKKYEMDRFVRNETQIMVATTVIEVGVNVPNASVMVIESAERFGLSQLHQLRGRVGRGAEQSYCILMTGDKLSNDSKKRIATMVRTNDGFEISEVDLELRGPGDVMGTQQSGQLNLKIANLVTDGFLITQARDEARNILKLDPRLLNTEHFYLREEMIHRLKDKPNWAEIS